MAAPTGSAAATLHVGQPLCAHPHRHADDPAERFEHVPSPDEGFRAELAELAKESERLAHIAQP
jgi:hypothetical protein